MPDEAAPFPGLLPAALASGMPGGGEGAGPMPQLSRDIIVRSEDGLHARPTLRFVDVANQFSAKVTVRKGGSDPIEANGKSPMQMMTLGADKGSVLTIVVDGEDAERALSALVELFENELT